MQWRSWFGLGATNREIAGSVPVGVIGIFHLLNPPGRTVTSGSTQFLPKMGRPVLRADSHTINMRRLSGNSGSLNLLEP
jgi:hypothetical protein